CEKNGSIEMATQDNNDLGPAEIKGFTRRYNQARVGHAAAFTAVVVLSVWLPLSYLGYIALLFAGGIAMFLLEIRGQRCPRCKGFVWWSGGPRDPSDPSSEAPSITLLQGPPERCRGCGVRLR